mgnify:FL=1
MNQRELDVLKAMYDAGKEMTSTDIVNVVPDLMQSTTITVMRALKNKGVIEPGGLQSTRRGFVQQYRPTEKGREVLMEYFTEMYRSFKDAVLPGDMCAAILEATQPSREELDKLSKMLEKYEQ